MKFLGHYGLIQYCPSAARGELANIGIILYGPVTGEVVCRVSPYRLKLPRIFEEFSADEELIEAEVESLLAWAQSARGAIDLRQFEIFCESTGQAIIRISSLRMIRYEEAEIAAEDLCVRLVGQQGPLRRRRFNESVTEYVRLLDVRFTDLWRSGRIEFRKNLRIPGYDRAMTFHYHYRNGRDEWVLAHGLNGTSGHILDEAARLAFRGRSLYRATNGQQKMVVLFKFEDPDRRAAMEGRIGDLFLEESCTPIPETSIEYFVSHVITEAKPFCDPEQRPIP